MVSPPKMILICQNTSPLVRIGITPITSTIVIGVTTAGLGTRPGTIGQEIPTRLGGIAMGHGIGRTTKLTTPTIIMDSINIVIGTIPKIGMKLGMRSIFLREETIAIGTILVNGMSHAIIVKVMRIIIMEAINTVI